MQPHTSPWLRSTSLSKPDSRDLVQCQNQCIPIRQDHKQQGRTSVNTGSDQTWRQHSLHYSDSRKGAKGEFGFETGCNWKSMRFMGFGRGVHIFGVVFPSKRILPLCVSVLRPTPPDCYLHPPHLIIFTINLQMGACLNHSLLQQRSTQDKDFSEKTKTGHLVQIGIWFLLELFGAWLPFYTHLRLRGCGRETIPEQTVWWIFWAAKQNAHSEQFIQFIQLTHEDTGCSNYSTTDSTDSSAEGFLQWRLRWVRLSCES